MNREMEKQIKRTIKRLAREDPRFHVNELRVIVALERAIARIEQHKDLAEHIIFKGGFVLLKTADSERFTRDADALALDIDKDRLKEFVCQALGQDIEDGLWFGDIQVKDLKDQGQYGSYRFDCAYQIGEPDLNKIHKLSRVHVDVGFSDKLPSKPIEGIMPSLIHREMPVSWRVYPSEYIFAEKLETLLTRASTNSRANDVYDLVYLMSLPRDARKLIESIRQTFRNRNTAIPDSFAKKVEGFNTMVLKAAWPGLRILGEKTDFESTWNSLLGHLEEIDDYMTHQ